MLEGKTVTPSNGCSVNIDSDVLSLTIQEFEIHIHLKKSIPFTL